jgi:hypothetical protein
MPNRSSCIRLVSVIAPSCHYELRPHQQHRLSTYLALHLRLLLLCLEVLGGLERHAKRQPIHAYVAVLQIQSVEHVRICLEVAAPQIDQQLPPLRQPQSHASN